MEPQFDDELQQLKNALRQPTFRFILIGHNRFSLYKDIADWLRTTFPERAPVELRLADKDYRHINDELLTLKKGIVLIPDFGWLFREGNEPICVAFNQRRDAFARLDITLICFIEPGEFIQVPKKVPDWWSLRSLELDFHRETPDSTGEFINQEVETSSSLGGQTKEEKQAEIQRLLRQVETTEPENKAILASLYSQLGTLSFDLSNYDDANTYWQQSLTICQHIGDRSGEGIALNNISQIYKARRDYEKALIYLEQSLAIQQQIGDQSGEGITLNNIGQIYRNQGNHKNALKYLQEGLGVFQQIGDLNRESATLNSIGQIYSLQGEYNKALDYLQQSLSISQQIGDRFGESVLFNNVGQIYYFQGEYDKALKYLQQSLAISQKIGNRHGEGAPLNNIGQIYSLQGEYNKALDYLQQSLSISQQIGDRFGESALFNNIGQIYYFQGEYDKALKYFQQSLAIKQQIGDQSSGIGNTLANIGVLYYEQYQDVKKSIKALLQAFNLFLQIGSPDAEMTKNYLNKILAQIGEEKYKQIVQSIQGDSAYPMD